LCTTSDDTVGAAIDVDDLLGVRRRLGERPLWALIHAGQYRAASACRFGYLAKSALVQGGFARQTVQGFSPSIRAGEDVALVAVDIRILIPQFRTGPRSYREATAADKCEKSWFALVKYGFGVFIAFPPWPDPSAFPTQFRKFHVSAVVIEAGQTGEFFLRLVKPIRTWEQLPWAAVDFRVGIPAPGAGSGADGNALAADERQFPRLAIVHSRGTPSGGPEKQSLRAFLLGDGEGLYSVDCNVLYL